MDIAIVKCKEPEFLENKCCKNILSNEKDQKQEASDQSVKTSTALLDWQIAIVVLGVVLILALLIFIYCKGRKPKKSNPDIPSSAVPIRRLEDIEAKIKQDTLLSSSSNDRLKSYLSFDVDSIEPDSEKKSVESVEKQPDNKASILSIQSTTSSEKSESEKWRLVAQDFKSSRDDEIDLKIGDKIYCIRSFDDGWAIGYNLATDKHGVFPLTCTTSKKDSILGVLIRPLSSVSTGRTSSQLR